MSGRGKYRNNRNKEFRQNTGREISLAKDSPVLALFRNTARQLNDRYDRHERLVKLSRDITIESKRIIFLLHSAISKEDVSNAVLEATERLNKLTKGPIKLIGLELMNSPAYLHSRAVSPGLQEFIEARTFCHLMQHQKLVSWPEVQKEFEYVVTQKLEEEETEISVVTLLPQMDFMLGLADLTGELMRKAINSISSGDNEDCFHSCQVVKDLYTGYLGIFGGGKELARKLSTTRANAHKAEGAAYALIVRGRHAPAPLLTAPPPVQAEEHSDDEGYY